jgi:hypothetical protein
MTQHIIYTLKITHMPQEMLRKLIQNRRPEIPFGQMDGDHKNNI